MANKLKVFTCTEFKGHYPVGTAATVVAVDAEDAAMLLTGYLYGLGLGQSINAEQMEELDLTKIGVKILNDGNY